MNRIVIEVSGGTVQNVWATDAAEVEIIDWDEFEHDGTTDAEGEEQLGEAIKGLRQVY